MVTIKQNRTKYAGLPLKSLVFMAKTSAPVDRLLKREVWKELFIRYFTEGRTFNLYEVLDKEPVMFANTIGWELNQEESQIPVEHSEDFISNLLNFIEFLDKQVLTSNNIQFEWQLHELQGLKSMLERVRDAKISDMNLRQKINLFIDKINQTRKETLILIEQKEKEKQEELNTLPAVQQQQELKVLEQKKELMQQELQHLTIPVSKMNKSQWLEAVNQIDMFYQKEQEKLIKQGLKKYPTFYEAPQLALRAFRLNLTLKLPDISMTGLLFRGLKYNSEINKVFGSEMNLYEELSQWYFTCKGSTKEGWGTFSSQILSHLSADEAKEMRIEIQLEKMRAFYPTLLEYTGKNLSQVISTTFVSKLPRERERNYVNISYSKETGNWIVDENLVAEKGISIFEHFYLLYSDVQGYDINHTYTTSLFRYSIESHPNANIEIRKELSRSEQKMIKDFCNFPSSLVIDKEVYNHLDSPLIKHIIPGGWSGDKGKHFSRFMRHKYNDNAISNDELKFLHKTPEGQEIFKRFTNMGMVMEGWLKEPIDFIAKFFERILNLFDFQKEEDRQTFFQMPFRATDFYEDYKSLKPEQADSIARKLMTESPHEYALISDYFSGINETYEEYKVHSQFEYLSDFERLILEREGIQTGEEFSHTGYKEKNNYGKEIYYTSKQAEHKFVIEFMKNLYAN